MKRFFGAVALLAIMTMSLVFVGGCSNSPDTDNGKVIKMGQAPYDYEVPFIEIAKQIAVERGYQVEIMEGEVGFMFMSLVQGDIDIWPGVWLPSIHETYQDKYGDKYELGSAIYTDAPVGWVVPNYVDADSIADLQGNEDKVGGKLIGMEPGCGMMLVTEEVIDGYDLDLEVLSGTMSSMMAEVDYAIKQQQPVLFLGWRPHTMMVKYDVKVLDDPKGYWEKDGEYWGIRKGFEDKAPDMYNFCKNFKMSLDDTEEFLYAYQEQGKNVQQLAADWIKEHRAEIDSWLE